MKLDPNKVYEAARAVDEEATREALTLINSLRGQFAYSLEARALPKSEGTWSLGELGTNGTQYTMNKSGELSFVLVGKPFITSLDRVIEVYAQIRMTKRDGHWWASLVEYPNLEVMCSQGDVSKFVTQTTVVFNSQLVERRS